MNEIKQTISLDKCRFCQNKLYIHNDYHKWQRYFQPTSSQDHIRIAIKFCNYCGWWTTIKKEEIKIPNPMGFGILRLIQHYGATASLKNFNLDDVNMPLTEIQNYIMAKYEARFDINPRIYEELVASIFRNIGYQAKVTAYTNDGGIDIVMSNPDGKEVCVQVKRYKNSIKVEQIRSFLGAMVLNDFTKGIFVTTSNYQSGAYDAINNASSKGLEIELIDAKRFLEALELSQKESFEHCRGYIDCIHDDDFIKLGHPINAGMYSN